MREINRSQGFSCFPGQGVEVDPLHKEVIKYEEECDE